MEKLTSASARTALPLGSLRERKAFHREERIGWAREIASTLYGERLLPGSLDITLSDHVEAVLSILEEFSPDDDAVIACILQHALEPGGLSQRDLEGQFGHNVREIVNRLRLVSHLNSEDWRRSIDDLKTMVVSISEDVRVILLKLCAQCYLIEHLSRMCPELHARLSRETLQLFSPVAARLGIYALKYRLEDSAFPVAYPTDAAHILEQRALLYAEHGLFLPRVVEKLQTFLREEQIAAVVTAREKHPYSIFQKMKRKSVSAIDKIHDLIALRVIVPTKPDCYQTLGLLHRIATPLAHRFKDYIALPKPNGYHSLHTCLIGLPAAPADVMIEVQIRTEEMHREAEYGIAAHWMYKEGEGSAPIKRIAQAPFSSDIYTLTPRGDIIALPKGSTPLDFAFAVHSDLGLKFRSARVNGTIAPLSHKLENGDVVEILTHKSPRPSLHWLEQLASSAAKAKLKSYFFSHNRVEFLSRGREVLNEELKNRHLPPLDNELSLLKTFDDTSMPMRERENVLVKIGMASVRASSILRHLQFPTVPAREPQSKRRPAEAKQRRLLSVEGGQIDMPFRFAKCCGISKTTDRSVPIVGFITRLGEISVHRDGCGMIRAANPARKVKVRWL